MKKLLTSLILLAGTAGLSGCGGCSGPPPEEKVEQPAPTGIGEQTEIVLADLLTKPRKDLAEQADEVATRVQLQEKARREGKLQFPLLPDLRLPLAVPVFREAKFNA